MNPFTYKGRIGRLKYLLGQLLVGIISTFLTYFVFVFAISYIIAFVSKSFTRTGSILFPIGLVVPLLIAILIPYVLSSTFIVKRFHDLGKSGANFFSLLIPIYNIHILIGLFTERGTIGVNQYGDDPVPNENPDDFIHRFSQNKKARSIAFVLLLVIFVYTSIKSPKADNYKTQQNNQQQLATGILNAELGQKESNLYSTTSFVSGFPMQFILFQPAEIKIFNTGLNYKNNEQPNNVYYSRFYVNQSISNIQQLYLNYFKVNGYTTDSTTSKFTNDQIAVYNQNYKITVNPQTTTNADQTYIDIEITVLN